MSLIAMLFAVLGSTLNASPSQVWTPSGFEKACQEKAGKVRSKVDRNRTHLQCEIKGSEISSVWFDKSKKMLGWLERTRNQQGIVTEDKEYDSAGALKEKIVYIRTSDREDEAIQNLFVFDGKGALKRGNISLPNENFVIATPELIFLSGQPSQLGVLASKLQGRFGVSSALPFYEQIQKIHRQQNSHSSSSGTPQKIPSAQ